MARSVTVKFNDKLYNATYNETTDEYEVELTAPETGGIYNAQISCVDGDTTNTTDIDIRILKQEQVKIITDDTYMYIFDYKDFTVKDVVELSNYEINIDEETNANTTVNVLKKTTAKSNDIVMIKENGEIKYWGIIQEIQNENGSKLYQYTIKFITNIFNQDVMARGNRVNSAVIEEGYYIIHSKMDDNFVLDVANGSHTSGTNLQLYTLNNTEAQIFKISRYADGSYLIQNAASALTVDVANGVFQNGQNVWMVNYNGSAAQKWNFVKVSDNTYAIYVSGTNLVLDATGGNAANNTNIELWNYVSGSQQELWTIEPVDENIIKYIGLEDYIQKKIEDNFINTDDPFINRNYIQLDVKTHTKIDASVSTIVDVQENIYNFHTFITNCTQLYNINFDFNIVNKKLVITIENKEYKKELIDVNAQPISQYTEVFETDVIAKVIVLTKSEGTYTLYLKTDRTTTEDATDENRAEGKTSVVYSELMADAKQKALDTFKGNSYNHNITFNYYDREIKVGTPITIKTKESLIYDTYISAMVKTKGNKFYKYTCGNIRINFIDKLKKERKNK
jgi:hypothetical protein